MTRVQVPTPRVLIGAPRRTPAVPNRDGTLALYSISSHDWEENVTTNRVQVMDLNTKQWWTITAEEGVRDVHWIPGTSEELIYLKSAPAGITKVYATTGANILGQRMHEKVTQFDAPVGNLKMKRLVDDTVAFVVTGLVGQDGNLFNEETEKRADTGRIYDTANIRQWDVYFKKQRFSLWYSALSRLNNKWRLPKTLHNLVQEEYLEAPYNMYDLVNPLDYFDVANHGVAFLARDLVVEKDPRKTTAAFPYFVPLTSYLSPPLQAVKRIQVRELKEDCIYAGRNMVFSPDGSQIVFQMADVNQSFNPQLFMAPVDTLNAVDVFKLYNIAFKEQDPPSPVKFWGAENNALLVASEAHGRTALSTLTLAAGEQPRIILRQGTVADFHVLKASEPKQLLVSADNVLDSSLWQILTIHLEAVTVRDVSSMTNYGRKYGLAREQFEELWIPGADGLLIHTWVAYPRDFDKTKKWPWVFIVHGGPEMANGDSWGTSLWSPLSWLEKGFVTVSPNFSGSTGYGVEFTQRILGQWGGKPFKDCTRVLEHMEKQPWLDRDKAILAGASFGGFMVSWFFCHDEIKKFCGAVWHHGIFSIPLHVLEADKSIEDGEYGGDPNLWRNHAGLTRWDPATPARLARWRSCPPTIVVHSARDYRVATGQGLATFKTLQAHGVPSRFLTFDDEGHFVKKPASALRWQTEVLDWAGRCVSGDLRRTRAV